MMIMAIPPSAVFLILRFDYFTTAFNNNNNNVLHQSSTASIRSLSSFSELFRSNRNHPLSTSFPHFDSSSSSSSNDANIDANNPKSNSDSSLLKEEEKEIIEEEKNIIIPTLSSLRNNIRNWSRQSRPSPHAPEEATKNLRKMFQYYNPNNNNNTEKRHTNSPKRRDTVDVIDCTQVINSWSKSRHKDAQKQILSILTGMNTAYKVNQNECIRPNVITYNTIINAYARRGDYDGSEQIFTIQLNDYKNEHNSQAKPDITTFTTMIDACSKSNRDDKPEIATKLLNTINTWYERGDLDEGPNTFTYNAGINCWSKSKRPDGPHRALDILEIMIAKYNNKEDDNNSSPPRPDTVTYNTVMDAYAKQGDVEGANNVLRMMNDDYHTFGNLKSKPDTFTYTILIDAWSKSSTNNSNAPLEAESLLMELIDLFKKGEVDGDGPNTFTYSGVINCWSKSNRPEGPNRAFTILETMILKYKEYGNPQIMPHIITYNTVMDAYAKRGDVMGAQKVLTLLKEDSNSDSTINVKPNVRTYTTLINAWSKSKNSDSNNNDNAPAKEAESLLEEMIDLFNNGELEKGPGVITYNAVINCWSKSNQPEGPSRALDILHTMITKYNKEEEGDGNTATTTTTTTNTNSNNIRPDTVTYSTVMDVYAKQGDVDGANKVFIMMKEDYNKYGNINAKPDIYTYTILIDAWNNYIGGLGNIGNGNNNKKKAEDAPFNIEEIIELINNDNNDDIDGLLVLRDNRVLRILK